MATQQEIKEQRIVDIINKSFKAFEQVGEIIDTTSRPKFVISESRSYLGYYNHKLKKIAISKYILNNDDLLETTILHEIAHFFLPAEKHNHKWQYLVARVGKVTGKHISRICEDKTWDQLINKNTDKKFKYEITCTYCNYKSLYTKETKAIKNIKDYYCLRCKVRHTLVVKKIDYCII